MFPRHLTVSFLILLLTLCTSCGVPQERCPDAIITPAPGDLTYLTDIDPIIGDYSTDSLGYMGNWRAEEMQISSAGKVSGTLYVQPKYRSIEGEKFVDILRFQVRATYILPCFGDTMSVVIGTFTPIYAIESTDHSAKFLIDTSFAIPPAISDMDGGMPLHNFELDIFWYRITEVHPNWISGGIYKVGATQTSANHPRLRLQFDKPPISLSGKLYNRSEDASDYEPFHAWLRKTYPDWYQFAAKYHLRIPLVVD